MRDLHIAPGLRLGSDFVTKTGAILAQRRKGKTYTGSVIAEEMVEAGFPFVALDPTGAWWGLRASADGKSEGLPVTILGGNHGDVPLDRKDGSAIADLVVEEPGYYVIDFNSFDSGNAEKEFATEFAKRLYRRKGEQGMDFPLHLFVDEADRFVPQRIRDKKETDEAMLGAFEAIVRRGGLRGLGTTLISQRAAVINKNVLEQLDVLFVLRVVGPNDRKAIMDYAGAEGTEEQIAELKASMPSLAIGEAWVWEPGEGLFARVHIRQRNTFNSSATPKPGQRRIEPRKLAPVELEMVRKRLAETIERQEAEDPVKLQQEVRELKRKLSEAQKRIERNLASGTKVEEVKVPVDVPVPVEIPVIPDVVTEVAAAITRHTDALRVLFTQLGSLGSDLTRAAQKVEKDAEKARRNLKRRTPNVPSSPSNVRQTSDKRVTPSDNVSQTSDNVPQKVGSGPGENLPKGEKAVLAALAMYHPEPRTQRQVAKLAGYTYSGGFRNIIYSARGKGYLEGEQDALVITDAGFTALGEYERLPMPGPDLVHWWLTNERKGTKLGKGEKAALEYLTDIYPGTIGQEDLAAELDYDYSGGFRNIVYRLRGLALIDGDAKALKADKDLMEG